MKVKESLKDPAKPFTMAVLLQAKSGQETQFEAAFVKAIQATRKEKGCITYDLNRDLQKPGHYVLYERWQNLPALNAHLHTPHITTLLKDLADLLDGQPDVHVMVPAAE
jgi:quinol monooxygenase YgiN